ESLKSVSNLEIPTNRMSYNKKTCVLSIRILDFMFVGIYKKSTRLNVILDDIFASLGETHLNRGDIYIIDFVTGIKFAEDQKLKHLKLPKQEKVTKKQDKIPKKQKASKRKDVEAFDIEEEEYYEEDDEMVSSISDDTAAGEFREAKFMEEPSEELLLKRDETEKYETERAKEVTKAKKRSKPLPAPSPVRSSMPEPKAAARPPPAPPADSLGGPGAAPPSTPAPTIVTPEEPQPKVYEINMGLQYYSVMMEQRSYLFYVYFSHEELKIVDEEGKTVYQTTIKIVTTKEEPPVLDLKIEGEGFEVHPIFGKVEVKKDAINPPVMIFSIMPLKSEKKKKKKKETERKFLNVYIEFEEKIISHTILSIIVQPKFFRLDIGPFHLNVSKKAAAIISFISVLITGGSLIFLLFSIDSSSSFIDYISGLAPGLGSILFVVIFLYTLLKEGIYPLKEKISAFLNFDQTGVLIK
ncbi:MAG: hypothetical protein ACW96S_12620, partial [Promethearchaeota archaeon]